jgi:hypothetical protein
MKFGKINPKHFCGAAFAFLLYCTAGGDKGNPVNPGIGIASIEIAASPGVIGTSGGKAKITAVPYDRNGKRMRNIVISFDVIKGSGREYIDPPAAATDQDGTASVYLMAGAIPSLLNDVWIEAESYGIYSNTVQLTIAGPPQNITVSRSLDITNGPGAATYGMKISALVSDVNNNPVADGLEVTFGVVVDSSGTPSPGTAVIITHSVSTQNGIADNELIYGQNDAGKIRVTVWAECQGIVTSDLERFVLPEPKDTSWIYE